LDAIGFEDKDVVVEAIRDTPIQAKLQQLVDGFPNRTWDETAKQIIDLQLLIASFEFAGKLYKVAGNEAVKAMARRTSLYFVPYAGWVYGAIVVCASIKKNWNILVC
jgi:hypothetical protein